MFIKADLHMHTTFSDGVASPREMLLTAQHKGLHAISITDHDTFEGSVRASRLARGAEGFPLVIIGIEARADAGDILVYCSEPIQLPYKVEELVDVARENNCLVVPAHPFAPWRLGIGELLYRIKGWSAVEVWNAANPRGANEKAIEAARALGLPGLSNSDAHIPDHVGVAYTVIEVGDLRPEEVMDSILRGRVSPHFGSPTLASNIKKLAWSVARLVIRPPQDDDSSII